MQEQTFRRVDVGVTLKVSPEGNVRPLTITFENGKTYTIDRLKERKRAAATKVGGTGIRYTVVFQNRDSYLFEDEGNWFVEAKKYGGGCRILQLNMS